MNLKLAVGSIALLLITSGFTAPHRKHHATKSVSKLRQSLALVRRQKQKLREELGRTRHQTKVVLADIQVVDLRLESVATRLEKTSQDLDSSRREQAKLAKNLVTTSKQLDQTRDQVRRRLRAMYVRGEGSFVSALAGTQSAGELASRKYLMESIAEKDRALFLSYQILRAQLAQKKHRQDELVTRVDQLAGHQKQQQGELEDTRAEKGQKLRGLREKQGELKELLDQFESDEREIGAQIAAYSRRAKRPGEANLPKFTGRLARPIHAPMTSRFGMRYHPILHFTRMHTGLDFGALVGSAIMAAGDGVVISTAYMRGYGNVVIVDHGGGVATVYAHTSRYYVSPGEHVGRGQRIAAVGSTGLSTGPHLHFEVRVNGHPVDPLAWL